MVTTKWVYYYYLFKTFIAKSYSISGAANGAFKVDETSAFDMLYNDSYCMEKVAVCNYALQNDERYNQGDTVPYGVPFYDTNASYKALMEIAKEEPIVYTYFAEPSAAAYVRYGFFGKNLPSDNVTSLTMYYPRQNFAEYENDWTKKNNNSVRNIKIVGYIETEADKLLSTGVPMDPNDENYKAVMAQISAPRIYSLHGNFLEDDADTDPKAYGSIVTDNKLNYRLPFADSVKEANPDYFRIEELVYSKVFYISSIHPYYTVYDVKELSSQKINYVIDNPEMVYNGVITTKWVYYYYLWSEYLNKNPIGEDAFNRVKDDKYCMEQIALIPDLLKYSGKYNLGETFIPVSDHMPPIAWPQDKDTYNVPYGTALKDLNDRDLAAVYSSIATREPLIGTYSMQTVGAAIERYNLLGDNKPEETTVAVKQSGTTKYFNIVGYVETEADKLLSAGVSMDENSAEYKTVIAQLRYPKIYSLSGKMLK